MTTQYGQRGGIPSFSPASPWLSAFVAAALVLHALPGSLHRADAAKTGPSQGSASHHPSLKGETNIDTDSRRLRGLNKGKGKKHDKKHDGAGDTKRGKGANKATSEEAIEEVVTAVAELDNLDQMDHGDTAGLELGLEEMAEDLIAATFPPGCSWGCYLANYPQLGKRLGNEAKALENWVKVGEGKQRDCHCKNETDIAAVTEAAVEEESVEEEVVENIEHIAEKIEALEGEDDDAAMVEKLVLAAVEEDLIAATFPPGCTWECYLDKHPWLTDHVARTEAAALDHYTRHDLDAWDCTCIEDPYFVRPASLRLQVWFGATVAMLAYWAAHQYRSLRRRAAEEAGAEGGDGDDWSFSSEPLRATGDEKPPPAGQRDARYEID